MSVELPSSPIDLPERRVGALRIEHASIKGEIPLVGFRQSLLTGRKPLFAKVETPIRIHKLISDKHGMWMSDIPEELGQIDAAIAEVRPRGRVLVGGLGLGCLALRLAERESVSGVVVVERDSDVIGLCDPHHEKIEVVHDDLLRYLRTTDQEFDRFMFDTWQATGEDSWWRYVLPLRREVGRRWGVSRESVWCWAEDIMLGQCVRAARSQKGKHWWYRVLPANSTLNEIRAFFTFVGLPEWEQRYGKRLDALTKEIIRREQSPLDAR